MVLYFSYYERSKYHKLKENILVVHDINPMGVNSCSTHFCFWYLNKELEKTESSFIEYLKNIYSDKRSILTAHEFETLFPNIVPIENI